MKNSKVLLLATLGMLLIPTKKLLAHLEKALYLQGKAGTKAIVVKMLSYDETPAVRYIQYFFPDDKTDRYMAGKLVNGSWQFSAAEQDVKNYPLPEGTFNIAANGPNWQGSWANKKGKKEAVTLTPIPADFIPLQFSHLPLVQQMDPYERYRLATLHFAKTTTEKFGNGLLYDWYIEKESGISFFRLRAKNNGTNTDHVNAALEAIHLSQVQKYFAYIPQKMDARPTTQLLYLSNKLVSFRTFLVSRLLTFTTTKMQLAATLDVATGATLKPEDLFWLDKTTSQPAAGDFFSLYQYRKKVFAPAIFRWLQELYPQKMKTAQCGINKAETWNLPAWNLTVKGVALGANSTDECGTFQWAIVPYEKLKPFINGKYHLPVGK